MVDSKRILQIISVTLVFYYAPLLAQDSCESLCKGLEAAKAGDFASALREWTPLAEAGNAEAQFYLGKIYFNGRGTSQDFSEAVKWYRRAADQEYVIAQFNLGQMHLLGIGVSQDYSEAVKWYSKAAEQ